VRSHGRKDEFIKKKKVPKQNFEFLEGVLYRTALHEVGGTRLMGGRKYQGRPRHEQEVRG